MTPSDTPRPPSRPFSPAEEADRASAPESREASSVPRPQKASELARVAKVMARAGLCSRRDAEAWILAGRVAVNGTILTSPALDVGPTDIVAVDGYPIDKPERTRLFLFHKTRGLVTTSRDPEGRPTVFDALPESLPRLMTIGRLDINTEGLLLLTNDGGLARLLELPATGWIRRYRVRANGTIDQAQLDALAAGVTIEGVVYAGIAAKLDRVQGANLWLTMGLKEGKNREIKRVLEHLGLAVTRLIRISFGPFQLGELADNAVEEVRTRVLRDQLGRTLAKQAGVDFDGPLADDPEEAPPRPAAGDPPRRQTRRSATADRRGRAVTVERIATVRPPRSASVRSRSAEAGGEAPARVSRGRASPPRETAGHDAPSPGRPDSAAGARRGRPAARPRLETTAPPAGRPRRPDAAVGAPAGRSEGRSRPSRAGTPAGRDGPPPGRPDAAAGARRGRPVPRAQAGAEGEGRYRRSDATGAAPGGRSESRGRPPRAGTPEQNRRGEAPRPPGRAGASSGPGRNGRPPGGGAPPRNGRGGGGGRSGGGGGKSRPRG